MKVLVIGGVAAGTKTAAKMKREDPSAEVVVITKGREISYAGCGLPYYVGGMIEEPGDLIVNTPESYSALTGVKVLTGKEATAVKTGEKAGVCGTGKGNEGRGGRRRVYRPGDGGESAAEGGIGDGY